MIHGKPTRGLERSVEVFLGCVLLLLLPLPLVAGVVGGVQLIGEQSVIRGLLVLSLSVLLVWFCAVVGWRLMSARRDARGRLMPVWWLYAGALIGSVVAARRGVLYGPEHANSLHEEIGKSLRESLGRSRSRRKR